MIKIENIVQPSNEQWMAVIKGMRNPMNSWHLSDTKETLEKNENNELVPIIELGENDFDLMKRLITAGSEHRKFLRMLPVTMDITAPLYWWKEYDTYKIGTTANSCSTMHKIHAKEFTLDDFSHEHLDEISIELLEDYINHINDMRVWYNETKDKKYWWQIIQLLPSSYNQKRTVFLNYEVLQNIYSQRKEHKLDEWREFCDVISLFIQNNELITKEF